jgi:hypothetical protein
MIRGRNSNFLLPDYLKEVYDEVERQQRISNEVENGEVLDLKEVRKMMSNKAVMIGRVGDVLGVKKEKSRGDFLDEIDVCNSESVFVQMAVEKAVKKCAALKTEKRDVVKQRNNVEKPAVLELPLIALHGRNVLNELMSWRVLRGMMVHDKL